MQNRKAILIGAGAIAREHIFAIQFIENIEVAAICDLSPARMESNAERFNIPLCFANYAEMLDKVKADFVHITTPPQSHYPIMKDCLERGFNVICEKPITSDLAEFQTLRRIAETNQLTLFENQNYRTQSTVKRIKAMADAGELGDIVEAQVSVCLDIHATGSVYNDPNVPHFSARLKGGVAGDFLTHMTYLAQMFIGTNAEPHEFWKNFRTDSKLGRDEFRAVLLGAKARAYLSFSGNAQPPGFWLKVIGTKAQVETNLFEPPRITTRKLRGAGGPISTFKDGLVEAKDIVRGTFGGLYRKFSGSARYDGLQEYIEKCYASLDTRAAAPVSIDEIEDCSRLVDAFCNGRQRT